QGGAVVLSGIDLVTPDAALRFEARPAGSAAWTELSGGRLVARTGQFDVRVLDEAGNATERRIDLDVLVGGHGAGAGCAVGGPDADLGSALVLVLGVIAVSLGRGRRKTAAMVLVGALGGLLSIGCSSETARGPCSQDDDCSAGMCSAGALPLCGDDHMCT